MHSVPNSSSGEVRLRTDHRSPHRSWIMCEHSALMLAMLAIFLLTACGAAPTAISLSTNTPLPTPPPTDTPVPTAMPTDTPVPLTATPEPTATPIPTATPENQIFRDDFNGELQPGWTWENENPARWTITPEGWLQIIGEDYGLLYGEAQTNLLWRDLPEGDFAVTVHLKAIPIVNFQQATLYLYEDLNNFVAINRGYCTCVPGGNGIFMEYKIGGAWQAYNTTTDETDLYLKLEFSNYTITGYYAFVPGEWQRLGRFGNYFVFRRVGLGAANLDQDHSDNADLVGLFDYFEITRP